MKIVDIMRKPVIVNSCSTLEEVLKVMNAQKVNSVLAIHEDWTLAWAVDVVTLIKAIVPDFVWNRDASIASFVNESIFEDFINDNKTKKVKYFMLETPKTINMDTSVLNACMIATEWRQARIPVVDDNNKPVWVFTRSAVTKYLATKI